VHDCILLGDKSQIGSGLAKHLKDDEWDVRGWNRLYVLPQQHWDFILCAIGSVYPVGLWTDHRTLDWNLGIDNNILTPLKIIHKLWKLRRHDAQVCLLAGSNPNKIMPGYSAYNVGKMALLKAVEQLNEETDAKWFALAPGIVLSKIHNETLEKNWPNDRLREAMKTGSVPIEKIYECLKWCLEQPKEKIGGRNICVSDDYRNKEFGPNTWKLRRYEGL